MTRTKRSKTPAKKQAPARRSPKAPALRSAEVQKPHAKRRQRRAAAAVRKDTTLLQTDRGPRVAWSASKPMFQKR